MRICLKLSEIYENQFIEKAAEAGKKDFRRYVNSVLGEVKEKRDISQRILRKASKKYGIQYQQYENVIDASLMLAPVFNYVSQSPEVRKSKELRPLRNQIQKLFRDTDLRKPRAVIEKAYGIIEQAKSGVKSPETKDFIDYMNQVEPQREAIIQGAVERLSGYNKNLKQTISKNIINDYLAYVEGGGSKQEAILYTLNSNSVKNESVIKRYLETEAHEDFEKAKIENAKQHGFKYKYWRTQSDERVRFSHMIMQGKIVANDEPFKVGQHKAMWPGDENLPIGERINCRCFTEFQFVPRGTRKGFELPNPKKPELPDKPKKIKIDEEEEKKEYKNGYSVNSAGVYDRKGNKKVDRRKLPMKEIYYAGDRKLPGWFVLIKEKRQDVPTFRALISEDVPIPEEWIEEEFARRANDNVWKRSFEGNPGTGVDYLLQKEKEIKEELGEEYFSFEFDRGGAYTEAGQNLVFELNGGFLDLIEKQNFDKPPKIISKDDLFNREPEELGMVIVRGYLEDTTKQLPKKNLEKYRKDFENGDFFVENKGGAVYGKGMYTASIYNGIDREDVYDRSKVRASIKIARDYGGIDVREAAGGSRLDFSPDKLKNVKKEDFTGRVDVMHLPRDFRYIEYDNVKKEKEKFFLDYLSKDKSKRPQIEKHNSLLKETEVLEKETRELAIFIREKVQKGIKGDEEVLDAFEKRKKIMDEISLKEAEIRGLRRKELSLLAVSDSLDEGTLATMMGYDGIYVKENKFMVILNRSKVELVEQDEEFELNHLKAARPVSAVNDQPSDDNEILQFGLRLNGIGAKA